MRARKRPAWSLDFLKPWCYYPRMNRYGKWTTLARFSDGSEYQCRTFSDERGKGLEYRIERKG